jgi:hypothetical protein
MLEMIAFLFMSVSQAIVDRNNVVAEAEGSVSLAITYELELFLSIGNPRILPR